jgi:Kelch motif
MNRESALNRGSRARSALALLTLVGLASCAQLGPTADPPPNEALGVTTLALPSASPWTSFATEARGAYAGVELGDGSVLVCGGSNTKSTGAPFVSSCNRFSFDGTLRSQTFPLPEGRIAGTLTLLPSNRVILAGGIDSTNHVLTARLSLPFASWSASASIFEPDAESAPSPRVGHTATRLESSVVLIGGVAGAQEVASIDVRSGQGGWTQADLTGALATRTGHTATVLKGQQGSAARVLVLGGSNKAQGYLSSGFIFSLPNTITSIRDMPDARTAHTATLLEDGSVLVVGGEGGGGTQAFLAAAWRYYPDRDSWVSAGSTVARKSHAAVRLGADVIVAGGVAPVESTGASGVLGGLSDPQPNPDTVQRYDPEANVWSRAPNLLQGRREFQLFALDQTHLLAVSGANDSGTLTTSEVFTAGALGQAPSDPNACVSGHLADGVCCNADCAGPCHWCNDPIKLGTCQLVTGATPNKNGCENRVECSAGSCAEHCSASSPCEAGYFCSSDGKCQISKKIGDRCSADGQCAGMPCVDGVCCESACSGSCEACNQTDLPGLCRPLPEGEAPRKGHTSCPAAHDSACAASCDGHTRDRCIFPAPGSACGDGTCTDHGFTPARQCDDHGTCLVASIRTCGAYVCDQGGCLDQCQDDQDCSGNNLCNRGVCGQCDELECNRRGYRCVQPAGECRNTCERSETDCAGGYYCHPLQHRCVEAVAFPAGQLPACGIGRERVRSRDWIVAIASLLCAVAVRKRRTSRRRAS